MLGSDRYQENVVQYVQQISLGENRPSKPDGVWEGVTRRVQYVKGVLQPTCPTNSSVPFRHKRRGLVYSSQQASFDLEHHLFVIWR